MRSVPLPRHLGTVAGVLLVSASLVLTACSGDAAVPPSGTTAAPSSPAPSASASDDTVAPPPANERGIQASTASPFTGRPGGLGRPVLAVKIDNTTSAQPHTGLGAADLVYVEEVEGGLTRLLAIYSGTIPQTIAPVRSARISDISLLKPFGRVAFAYSGAQRKLLPKLAQANLFDRSPLTDYTGWGVQPWRPISWNNHTIDPSVILQRTPRAAKAADIGLTFSAQPPEGGEPASGVRATWPASRFEFRWSAAESGYIVSMDGAVTRSTEDGPQVADTVVVQRVRQSDSGFGDRYGGRTPLIQSVGSGEALVLRDGQVWQARWSRPRPGVGTTFTQDDGASLPFAIGQSWILLLPRSAPAQLIP